MAGCHHPRPQGTRGRKSLETVVVLGEGLPCAMGTVGANSQTPLPSSSPIFCWGLQMAGLGQQPEDKAAGGRGCRGQPPVAQSRHGAGDRR